MNNRKIPALNISIRNESDNEAVIDIDGEIGWVSYDGDEYQWNTAPAIKKKLKEIAKLDADKIIVNINSLGGFVDDGLAIHDALAQHPAEIETRVTGMTASAATIIAQAGDIRKMSDNALYLIHHAWGLAIGNVFEIEGAIDDMKQIDKRIAKIYAKRSGKSEEEFLELMGEQNGAGRWIDADEAKEYGLIDEAFEPMKAAASVDARMLRASGLPVPESVKELQSDRDSELQGDKGSKLQSDRDSKQSNIKPLAHFDEQNNRLEVYMDGLTMDEAAEVMKNFNIEKNDSRESEDDVPSEGMSLEEARNMEVELLTK